MGNEYRLLSSAGSAAPSVRAVTQTRTGPDILSAEYDADPYPFAALMRDEYPLYQHGQTGFHVVSRYSDVHGALKEHPFTNEVYAWQAEPVYGVPLIMQLDGAEHTRHHHVLAPPLRGRDLTERVIPGIERIVDELIAGFADTGEVDIATQLSRWVPINVMALLFDLPDADRERFYGWYSAIIAHLANFAQVPSVAEAGVAARTALGEYLDPFIERRRAEPGTDMISALCAARIDGRPLTHDEIRGNCALMLSAGGETTVMAISATIKNLVCNPGQLAAVRADRSLVERACAEALRLDAPAHIILRSVAEDVEVSGGTVPRGATVACVIAAANRDPRRFDRADTFDLFRPEIDPRREFGAGSTILSFGRGRHFCIGALLAKAEVVVAVNRFLDVAQDITLATGDPLPESGVFGRKIISLPLRFTPTAA